MWRSGSGGDVSAVRVPIRSELSFEQGVLCLRGDRRPFALAGDWFGGLSVLGSEPIRVGDGHRDPFALLEELPAVARGEGPAVGGEGPAVGGGWVGWLGYGLGSLIERLPPPPPAPVPRPLCSLAYYDHVVLYDGGRWWFEALLSEPREAALRERLRLWQARLTGTAPTRSPFSLAPLRLVANGADGHLDAVSQCRARIAAGELFQANLCVRLESRLSGDPLDLFCAGWRGAQPRFGALVDGAVSLSPERFLRRVGRRAWTEPIKGTRPRSDDASGGADAGREQLLASEKDSAEHVMIVDLMRNDLGRVCEYGSITARRPRAEAHAGVWHLVSTVSGTLRPRVGDGDLLRAAFPPGSVTGAPKVQAMKVISELEATRRELYTGAIGLISPIAGLDMSVAIRTFEIAGERVWFGAGGGIVADSDPELELAEALTKARGPARAVGGEVRTDWNSADAVRQHARTDPPPVRRRARSRPRANPPRALTYGLRPDPAVGVFETILVEGGRPLALAEHLARLESSARVLYGRELDREALVAGARTACEAVGERPARLRVLLAADGAVEFETAPVGRMPGDARGAAAGEQPVTLAPFLLAGGLGAHKWRDRRLLDALGAQAPDAVPLLLDTDGEVLEATFANVWLIDDGPPLTPPADGRLLPGVTRAALLASEPGAREQAFDLERMLGAQRIFLTSSIAGRLAARLAPQRGDVREIVQADGER